MITHLEPDILESEVKWALGRITTNKAIGSVNPSATSPNSLASWKDLTQLSRPPFIKYSHFFLLSFWQLLPGSQSCLTSSKPVLLSTFLPTLFSSVLPRGLERQPHPFHTLSFGHSSLPKPHTTHKETRLASCT